MADDPSDPSKDAPRKPKVPYRDEKGRLLKGAPSQNPGGRPKGLAARIRAEFRDGEDIVALLKDILEYGQPRDQLEAAKIVLDRGWGKSVETTVQIEASAKQAAGAVEISTEQLEALALSLKTPALASGTAPRDHVIDVTPVETKDNNNK